MAEGGDQEDKTEEPTPKKQREAREKGQVAQSREVNTFVMLFVSALLILTMGVWMSERLSDLIVGFIAQPEIYPTDGNAVTDILMATFSETFGVIAIFLGGLFIAGLVAGFAQVGPMMSTESLMPSLDKINPMKGFSRIFGKKAWIEFLKGVAKMIIVGSIATVILIPIFNQAPSMIGMTIPAMIDSLLGETKSLFIGVLSFLFVLAVADYGIQYFQLQKTLRMSLQEIKDEYKQTEGDPHIKARLRQIRLERARKRMMAAVPDADVIITNPTHFSIALQYDQSTGSAPKVVAKGQDLIALKIREIAKANDITIVENKPLARALFDTVDLDEEIPEEHYKAVAEIISYVYSLRRK
jgi:flagellar biosynthetic protein FlhB